MGTGYGRHQGRKPHSCPRITSYNVCYTKLLRNISDDPDQLALNEQVIHEAKVIAQLAKANLHLVNAFPAPIVNVALELPGFTPELYNDAMQQHHQTEMDAYARKFDLSADVVHIVEGMPEDVLPELATTLDAELTILGSVGRTGWSAAFIGNTAERVIDSIQGDLLVVKTPHVE